MNAHLGSFVALGLCAVAGIYLFVSAPPPLAEPAAATGPSLEVRQLFEMCYAENAAVRKLYTEQIVGAGKQSGLKFSEHWRDSNVQAGPLPALFLRETARNLERAAVGLSLFLGSDAAINASNRFNGATADAFQQMRRDHESRFFHMDDVKLYAGMFPDVAVSQTCVDCHNQNADSPKHDWKRGDIMGAVTWTYPKPKLTTAEALRVVAALRNSFADTYAAYLVKARTFIPPPEVSSQWPTSGYFLPTQQIFMESVTQITSPLTLQTLIVAAR